MEIITSALARLSRLELAQQFMIVSVDFTFQPLFGTKALELSFLITLTRFVNIKKLVSSI
jgi:hypothetical protein